VAAERRPRPPARFTPFAKECAVTPKSPFSILDAAAREHVPEDANLLPQITARVAKGNQRMQKHNMKLITILLIVFLALMVITTTGYAIYQRINDSGLQSIQDAGLVKNINITAGPTFLPTSTLREVTETATLSGNILTQEGVTLTLKWVYLDANHLALGVAFDQLPSDMDLDAPVLQFENVTPIQPQGWSFHMENSTAEFISYQLIQVDASASKVNLGVDIPLVRLSGDQRHQIARFHFDLRDVPIIQEQAIQLQQTYSARINGIQLFLKSVWVSPAETKAVICYNPPDPQTSSWSISKASLQLGNTTQINNSDIHNLIGNPSEHCSSLSFPTQDTLGNSPLKIKVLELAAPSTTQNSAAAVTGPWEFYAAVPQKDLTPGQELYIATQTPAVIGSQTLAGVTIRLDWAFADARRIALGYSIMGLPQVADAIGILGTVVVKDANGNIVGYYGHGSIKWLDGEPETLNGTWSSMFQQPLSVSEAQFSVDITLGGADSQFAQFDISPSATPFPPGAFPPVFPDHVVGTYHFDFNTKVYPEQDLTPDQTITVNGLEMRLDKVEMTPSYAKVTLCYQKPSAKDWGVGGIYSLPTLDFAGYEASVNSYALLFDSDLGGNIAKNAPETHSPQIQTGRCVAIDFLLGNSNQPGTATLTIPDLELSLPEVIPDAEVQAAQEKLKAEGIVMDYSTFSSASGGGGGGPVFSVKPDGMTDQQAYQKFVEALGYVVPGPWIFTFNVNP
jgi:hypothetical protein